MQIPKRYQAAKYTDWTEGSPVRVLIEDYLNNFDQYFTEGQAPLLVGKSGSGKTHAAAAIMNAIRHGANETLRLEWYSASEVFNQLIDAKDLHMRETYVELKSNLRSSDLLVLDDISALRSYARLKEALWNVLEYRYSEVKPTIITANFTGHDLDLFSDMAEEFDWALIRRIKDGSKNLKLIL